MLSILEAKELVTKDGSGANRYRGNLRLTPAERAVEQAGEGLTEENRAIFYESLDTITKNLRRICQEGLK